MKWIRGKKEIYFSTGINDKEAEKPWRKYCIKWVFLMSKRPYRKRCYSMLPFGVLFLHDAWDFSMLHHIINAIFKEIGYPSKNIVQVEITLDKSWCTPFDSCRQSLFMSTLVTCQSWSFVNEMIFPYQNNLRHILLRISFLPSCCLYHSRNDIVIITLPQLWMFLLLFFMKNILCINISCHENKTRLSFIAWNGDAAY